MKAITFKEYGTPEVLNIEEVEKPIPEKNEVLIRIIASSVTQGDWRMRKPYPLLARLYNGLFRPKRVNILGFEVSGIIEAVGDEVKTFHVNDEVYAFNGFKFGGYAEYICLPIDSNPKKGLVCKKPKNLNFEAAAVVPCDALTAYSHLKKMLITKETSILVYGASGSVGTYFLQLAKEHGAKVTGVCSTKNIELIISLGAHHVIDYTKENYMTDVKYDYVFDAVDKLKKSRCKKILTEFGQYISVADKTHIDKKDLQTITNIIESDMLKPVIDKTFTCHEIREAHKYVEAGHKVGNVSLKIEF